MLYPSPRSSHTSAMVCCLMYSVRLAATFVSRQNFVSRHGSLTSADQIRGLHVNTKGQAETFFVNGHRNFATVVKKLTRFTVVRPIRSKSDGAIEVFRYIKYFEKQSKHTAFEVHSGRGTKFRKALNYSKNVGLETTIFTPHTSESNGLAERNHQTILALARICFSESKVRPKY